MKRVIPVEPWNGRDAEVSSPFGDPRAAGPHRGVDYMFRLRVFEDAPKGVYVYKKKWVYPTWARAAADGIVVAIARAGNGLWVRIDHGDGWQTQYGHLGELEVERKQQVSAGQKIAGPCILSQMLPPHLHFGLSPARHPVLYQDPVPWLALA